MMRRTASRAFAAIVLAAWATVSAAQEADAPATGITIDRLGVTSPDAVAAPDAGGEAPAVSVGAASVGAGKSSLDYDAWGIAAQRGEQMTESNIASVFAFERLRAELVQWRDMFDAALSTNASRLSTVDAQIVALGPKPEEGEDSTITQRRDALQALRQRLAAPSVLASEAYAHADGLIGEVDALIRERQAARLMVRGPSTLNPVHWPEAATTFVGALGALAQETVAGLRHDLGTGRFWGNLPVAIFYLGIAAVLLLRSRGWALQWQRSLLTGTRRGRSIWAFLASVGQIIMPVLGLFALSKGLDAANVLGLRGTAVIKSLPAFGGLIIFARWLVVQLFPRAPLVGPLGYSEETSTKARRVATLLAWTSAMGIPITMLLSSGDGTAVANATIQLPIDIAAGILLFRLGMLLGHAPETQTEVVFAQGRLRLLVGRFVSFVGFAAPTLSATGYFAAAHALFLPVLLTMAILGVMILLQKLVFDIFALWQDGPEKGNEALTPMLIAIVLFALALPALALVWGVRVEDMLEVWTRFREGFSIGDTKISPSNFATFLIVFGVGYLVTGFVQSTLRTTILPRTKIDLGARNALVAGIGYVGILLAAIVAITTAGIDLSNLAIVAGALSVGIGFGLQNIVSNFVAGIILLIERPISEGDWIEVGGQMGYVRNISVRSTRIETFDRTDVIVPNGDLVSGVVTNWTRGNLIGRAILPIGVAYGTDVDRVTAILREIAEAHPMVLLTPPPSVLFRGFGADSLDFEIRAILRDVNFVLSAKSEMNHEIAKRFAQEGIEIPFAQRDIWLRNPEVLRQRSDNGEEPA